MTCTVAPSGDKRLILNLSFGSFEPLGNGIENSLFCQSLPSSSTRSFRMQVLEAAALHFGSTDRLTGIGSTRACSSSLSFSFSDDPLRKQASEFTASLHASLLSKCQGIVLFPSSTRTILKGGVSSQCCAKHPKTIIDQASLTSTEPLAKDEQGILIKQSASRSSAPLKRMNGRKSVKLNLTSRATRTDASKLTLREIEETRVKLENLGAEEPALFKYLHETTPAGVPVDDIVSYVSSLMGIIRVSWSEAVSMLWKHPSLLKLEVSKLEQTVTFLNDLVLSKYEITKILVNHPPFLEYDLVEVKATIDYLLSVGLSKVDIHAILQGRPQAFNGKTKDVKFTIESLLQAEVLVSDLPRIISRTPDLFSPDSRDHLKSRLHFFKQVGLYGGSLGKGIARRPNLLYFDLEAMKQAYNYLSEFLPPSDVSKLVCRFAEVLVIDPKRKMEPMVNHLLRLGVKRTSLGKVLLRRPQLLGYTIAGLEPTIQYLKELGVTEKKLGRVISISPQVLTLNCEEKLKPAVKYLRSLGLVERKDMERLLVRNAQLLCCSIEKNITPKFNFFLDMGLNSEDVIKMLVMFPSMFGQSIEASLEPKYRYLVDVMNRSPEEVIHFPQYFGYSLEKRIKPRYERLAERGIANISLPSMLACIEEDFIIRYLTGNPPSRAPYSLRKASRKSKYNN